MPRSNQSREAAKDFSPGWSRKAEPWVSGLLGQALKGVGTTFREAANFRGDSTDRSLIWTAQRRTVPLRLAASRFSHELSRRRQTTQYFSLDNLVSSLYPMHRITRY
jgi:hypothetical protein